MAIKTITVKGDGVRNEADATGAITPGHLVERTSTGTVQVHSTAGGNAQRLFALEDDLQGKEISEAYANGDKVQFNAVRSGDVVNALITGSPAVAGFLESAGDGTLQAHTADSAGAVESPLAIVGVLLETKDGTTNRAKVEIV